MSLESDQGATYEYGASARSGRQYALPHTLIASRAHHARHLGHAESHHRNSRQGSWQNRPGTEQIEGSGKFLPPQLFEGGHSMSLEPDEKSKRKMAQEQAGHTGSFANPATKDIREQVAKGHAIDEKDSQP